MLPLGPFVSLSCFTTAPFSLLHVVRLAPIFLPPSSGRRFPSFLALTLPSPDRLCALSSSFPGCSGAAALVTRAVVSTVRPAAEDLPRRLAATEAVRTVALRQQVRSSASTMAAAAVAEATIGTTNGRGTEGPLSCILTMATARHSRACRMRRSSVQHRKTSR